MTVKFDGSAKTTPRDVTGDTTITAKAAAGTTTNTFVVNGPTSFTYKPTNTPATYSDAELMSFLTFVDMPGTKGDSVTMTKAEGVHWKIGTVTYDEAKFGAKTSVTAKLNAGVKVFPIAVGATLSDADGAVAVGFNGVTDAAKIEYTADQLKEAVVVGDNPFDATKGVGKGASVETVKITGLPGIKWKVGSSPKAINVKPGAVAFVSVPADDLDGAETTVPVTPVPAAGFTVPTNGTPAKATPVVLQFEDDNAAPVKTIGVKRVDTDRSGTVNDTLVLPAQRGMSWFAGQKDAKGKLTYKQLKAGKDDNAVYKVKHSKDGKDAVVVYYRAVPDRGYRVNNGLVQQAPFEVKQDSVTAPEVATGAVTLEAAKADGVASWEVTKTIAEKAVKTSYKPADLAASGVTSIVVPADTSDVKVVKGYSKV